jgi:hypothetical protein
MITLRAALQATSWRLLIFIARRRGLSLSSKTRKADLISQLTQLLPDPANLANALAALSPAQRQALDDLLIARGRLPLRHLHSRHGNLSVPADLTLAQTPGAAPLERLRGLGLIFHDRASDEIFIPTDLIPLLPQPDTLPPPRSVELSSGWSPVDLLCHDLTYLLALLQRDDISPLHGRWLPPRVLAEWGQGCAAPPWQANARSELQTGRRRFIHYLAENAEFVSGQGSVGGGPLSDALPEEESLPLIEQALAEGCNLQIDYYAAGSNTRTRREVEPYRLEWRGETPYLIGFCHLAQSERIFRVDRIYSVVKVQSDEA